MDTPEPDAPPAAAPVWRRPRLPRNSKHLHLNVRPRTWLKLQQLARLDTLGRREPIVCIIERLVDLAPLPPPTPAARLAVHLKQRPGSPVAS